MKNVIKFLPVLLILGILFALPVTVFAQTPNPGTQTFSGDQLVLGNNYTLKTDQVLNGTLVVLGGNAEVQDGATVNGDVAIVGGNLNLAGTVTGTISILGGNVSLNDTAVVMGDIVTFGGNVSGENQATIKGSIRTLSRSALLFNLDQFNLNGQAAGSGALHAFGRAIAGGLLNILKVFGIALLALVVVLILPKPVKTVTRTISAQPLLSGGVGILTAIVFPILLVILTITIILIPLTLIGAIIFALAALFGWIAAGTYLGERLEVLFKAHWADAVVTGLGTLAIGLAVWLLNYAFCLGGLLTVVVASLGLGGVVLSRFGTTIYEPGGPGGNATIRTVPQPFGPSSPAGPVIDIHEPRMEPESPAPDSPNEMQP